MQINTGGIGVLIIILILLIIGIDLDSIIIFTDIVIHLDIIGTGINGNIETDLI
jgi:hypothetical protein